MRRLTRTFPLLAALLLGAACAVLVACGGSGSSRDLIPAGQASTMIDQLDTIQNAVAKGRCSGVDNEVATLQTQINGLSNKVDARLRNRLQEGVNNLNAIAPDECFAQRDRQQTTATTPTTTTQTTTTQTTTTQTTPTTTTPTETTPTTPTTTPTTPADTTTTPPGGATVPGTGGTGAGDGGTGGASPATP